MTFKKIFLMLFLCIFLSFAIKAWCKIPNFHTFDYIIDTDIGCDIDDVFALLVALNSNKLPLAITTTHIDPMQKAKIAKLLLEEHGFKNIPVYAGVGVTRKDSTASFLKLNPLYPPAYGVPNPQIGQKKWFEKQASAYHLMYGHNFEIAKVEEEDAPTFIARTARRYSSHYPLIIVAIGPLFNIDAALKIDPQIKNNILLYSMGGTYPKGYNWLIAPATTARVLQKIKTITISSDFIERNHLFFSQTDFAKIEKSIKTKLGQTILADWKNWLEVSSITQLGDPVTLYLALHPNEILKTSQYKVTFPCLNKNEQLKAQLSQYWYSMPGLENKLITVNKDFDSQIKFVEEVKSPTKIKKDIMNAIINHL